MVRDSANSVCSITTAASEMANSSVNLLTWRMRFEWSYAVVSISQGDCVLDGLGRLGRDIWAKIIGSCQCLPGSKNLMGLYW